MKGMSNSQTQTIVFFLFLNHWILWYPDDIYPHYGWFCSCRFRGWNSPRDLTLSRFAGGRQCQLVPVWCCAGWVTWSLLFYHEKIGHFLSRYNWAHPIFGGLYLVYSSQPTTEKCTSDVQHRRRQVTGYALYLGYVRHSRDGDNPDLWENSLWKPSILAAMVIGDGSWHWLWFTWLYHKNRGIV